MKTAIAYRRLMAAGILATATLAAPAPASAFPIHHCVIRPQIAMQTVSVPGRPELATTITDQTPFSNAFTIRFGQIRGATARVNGQVVLSGQTVASPVGVPPSVVLVLERSVPARATFVPFTVVNHCGEWPTFVGAGPRAG